MNIVDSAMLRAAISRFRSLRSKAEISRCLPPFEPSDNSFVINRRSLFSANRFSPNGSRIDQPWQTKNYLSTEAAENSWSSSQADDILITDNCIRRMKELQKEEGLEGEKILRLSVEGGGCSGFQYSFTLDDKPNKDDRVFEKEGIKLVVDDISYGFVKGATVDYVEELIRCAFMVTRNPNAGGGCGCGSSFTVK